MISQSFWFIALLFIPVLIISFLISLWILPGWIKRAHEEKLTGTDVHKKDKRPVAEGGGISVLTGFIVALFLYIAIKTFIYHDQSHIIDIFALFGLVLFSAIVGLFDDLLGWKKGLSKKLRLTLILFSAVPLMVLNVGQHTVLGIQLGILYPLLIIPIAVLGATTTFNFLAGYNGLESSQGILILAALSVANFITGNWWLALISGAYVTALFAFFLFNKYPAKVFPGDILTYPTGAIIAGIAIVGNMEKFALILFVPYILEVILKVRGKLKKESFSKVLDDGSLTLRYDKIYGLEHIAVVLLKKFKKSKKAYEWEVPILINIFQLIIILIGFAFFLG